MAIEEGGKRITALRDTLRRVTSFATKLNPEGISIRVLNRTIGDVDYRKSEHEVEKAMRNVRYEGPTLLGTVLESKIIYPLITRKAYDKKLKKPVIVVIVTDGEVSIGVNGRLNPPANRHLQGDGRAAGDIARNYFGMQEIDAFLQPTSRLYCISHLSSGQLSDRCCLSGKFER